jgi:carbon-monoxide dehydrogenase large subunit
VRQYGVKDIDMPTTPYRVWTAINTARGTSGRGDEADIASPGAGLGSTASDISKGDTEGGHL